MRTKHAFKPSTLDPLESREVPSNVVPPFGHVTQSVAPTTPPPAYHIHYPTTTTGANAGPVSGVGNTFIY